MARRTTLCSKQLFWAVAGFIAMIAAMRIDYRRYKHPAVVFSLLAVTTILLLCVFALDRSHNTHRWIHWGGFSFQPSELAKPALILFLGVFPRVTVQADRRLAQHAAARSGADYDLSAADRGAAGPAERLSPARPSPPRSSSSPACRCAISGTRFCASILPLYFLLFHVSWRRDRILRVPESVRRPARAPAFTSFSR